MYMIRSTAVYGAKAMLPGWFLLLACIPCLAQRTGIGMTMPVDPPAEQCNLNLPSGPTTPFAVPNAPSDLLAGSGYNLAPIGFLATQDTIQGPVLVNFLTGTCSTNLAACPASGKIDEQNGRLNGFLRANAATQDSRFILADAVWVQLGLTIPVANVNPDLQISTCGGTPSACATALAQLAVTGREAYNSFIAWDPQNAPSASGPQPNDLANLLGTGVITTLPTNLHYFGYNGTTTLIIPPLTPAYFPGLNTAAGQLQFETAVNTVLQQAYDALYAIRSNQPAWRQYRAGSQSWIAVSGEDDTPERPVNVPTAPFPQYDIAVPVTANNGQSYTLSTRYMFASNETQLRIASTSSCETCNQQPVQIPLPPIPTTSISATCPGTGVCREILLTLPTDSMGTPPALSDSDLTRYIIYIHGGGSRLEEAVPLAKNLLSLNQFRANYPFKLVVISFDLPNSAYAEQLLRSTSGSSTLPLDPALLFENYPTGNVYNYPILGFTMQFVTNFIHELGQQGVIDPRRVVAVMGGSLGGNTSLLLSMNGAPSGPSGFSPSMAPASPYNATNALNNPIVNPLPALTDVVAWSVTAMVPVNGAGLVVGNNLGDFAPTWAPELLGTRSAYFMHIYYAPVASIAGLGPDPETWYRNDWTDNNGVNDCKAWELAESRFDRYEIYSDLMRRWTSAIDTEQAIFSFQTNTDATKTTYQPNYSFITRRALFESGACDDFDNGASPFPFPTAMSTGTCNGSSVGNTGSNAFNFEDIYGFSHDVANDMQNASGKTLFVNDTGHSIHDERPVFLAGQVLQFLNTLDNNINISLFTGDDDVRWNSEVHVKLGLVSGQTIDQPLNYWFHPSPAGPIGFWSLGFLGNYKNPCGWDCTKLNTFRFKKNTVHNFTIALPDGTSPVTINTFQIEFLSGWDIYGPPPVPSGPFGARDRPDKWDLAGVASCLPGTSTSFVNDGTTSVPVQTPSTLQQLQAHNVLLRGGVLFTPPSFLGTASVASQQNNCNGGNSNPPANSNDNRFL